MKNLRRGAGLRLLPLIAVLGLGAASASAHAATTLSQIKITSGSDVYTCNLNGFTVSGGVVSISTNVASCNPALSGGGTGGTDPDPNPDPGPDPDPDPNPGSGTGGTGGTDPGTGSWSPDLNATPRVVVVGQSGGSKDAVTIIPGCVNGGSAALGSSCSTASEYNANLNGTVVPVKLTQGQILSVRYPVSSTASGSSTGSIKLANSVGGAIGINTKISLSPTPGDMTGGGQSRCTSLSTSTPSVSTGTNTFACKVDRSKSMYYLNVEVQQACTGSNCIFYISEGSSEFL